MGLFTFFINLRRGDKIMTFGKWLKNTSDLSDSSVYKYTHAVKTISDDMLSEGVVDKPLAEMELYEVDLAIAVIFHTRSFIDKDTRGNHMYSTALKWYRFFLESSDGQEIVAKQEEARILSNPHLDVTERQAIVKSRIGQGQFRENLLSKYGKCVITGVNIPQVLVASHIKPWAACDNRERLDVNNGLILSATYDRLFDSGLISFNEHGNLLISKFVSDANRALLSLDVKREYQIGYSSFMRDYLQYHNDVIYLK